MTTDAVVIGAGVIGTSVALELARAGRRVTIIDRGAGPGLGSTSASSAVVRFNFSTYAGVATAWESHFCWRNWGDHLGFDVGMLTRFERCGLAMLDVEAVPREAYLPFFRKVGVPFEEWDSATLSDRIPGIDVGRYGPPKKIYDDEFWSDANGALGGLHPRCRLRD